MSADVTVRPLIEDDLHDYQSLRDHSWGFPPGDDGRELLRGRLYNTVGAFDARGKLLASAAGPRFETFVAGSSQPLLGIAAVQTAPTARRRGLAAQLLARLLADGRDAGIGWSLLYPFDPRYYARLGWQSLPCAVRLAVSTRWWGPPAPPDAEQVKGDLRAEFQALHLRCASLWNFSNARTEGPWDVWAGLLPPPGERGAAYRVEDGYAVVRLRQEDPQIITLEVLAALWCSARGRRAVLALLGTYQGQVQRIELEVPADDALAWDWEDWWRTPTQSTRMVRVVDLQSAFAGLDPAADMPALTLRVRDSLAPWNDGTWRLSPAGDGCRVEPSVGLPDAELDVRALPLLLGGGATPDAVVRAGLAEGSRAALSALASLSGGFTPYHSLRDRF